jgi:peroxiredoxin
VSSELEKTGAQPVFIAAEKRGGWFKPEQFLADNPVPFPFLLDEDRRVTKAYGVYHRLGMDAVNIARPATFVVDRGGVVRLAYVGMTQTDRMALGAILEIVKKL